MSGDRRAIARAISGVEDGDATDLVGRLHPRGGKARVVGITGSAGSGKSTLTDRLITVARAEGLQVAVLAIDPSSPFSGGAVLGDRIRMQDHVGDAGVFVRSMSTRGALGGLSNAAAAAVVVLDAGGFDLILVETVGVGQSEVDVIELVETTIVVVAPGFGDDVQAAKAGLLEIADLFVVAKKDLPGAEAVGRDLRQMLELGSRGTWEPPVVAVSALQDDGIDELWRAIEQHGRFLAGADGADARRRRVERSIRTAMLGLLAESVHRTPITSEIIAAVERRELDPWEAAARVAQTD